MKDWPLLKRKSTLKDLIESKVAQSFLRTLFDYAYANKIDTWDIAMVYSFLFNDTYSIVPKYNLVSNIGIDGTHTNNNQSNHQMETTDFSDFNNHPPSISKNSNYEVDVYENKVVTSKKQRLLLRLGILS